MATIKDDDSEGDDKKELLNDLDDETPHIIDVLLGEYQPDEENIFSDMASIDDENEHSSYISRLNYVSAFHSIKRDVTCYNVCDINGIITDTGAAQKQRRNEAIFCVLQGNGTKGSHLQYPHRSLLIWYCDEYIIWSRQYQFSGSEALDPLRSSRRRCRHANTSVHRQYESTWNFFAEPGQCFGASRLWKDCQNCSC